MQFSQDTERIQESRMRLAPSTVEAEFHFHLHRGMFFLPHLQPSPSMSES